MKKIVVYRIGLHCIAAPLLALFLIFALSTLDNFMDQGISKSEILKLESNVNNLNTTSSQFIIFQPATIKPSSQLASNSNAEDEDEKPQDIIVTLQTLIKCSILSQMLGRSIIIPENISVKRRFLKGASTAPSSKSPRAAGWNSRFKRYLKIERSRFRIAFSASLRNPLSWYLLKEREMIQPVTWWLSANDSLSTAGSDSYHYDIERRNVISLLMPESEVTGSDANLTDNSQPRFQMTIDHRIVPVLYNESISATNSSLSTNQTDLIIVNPDAKYIRVLQYPTIQSIGFFPYLEVLGGVSFSATVRSISQEFIRRWFPGSNYIGLYCYTARDADQEAFFIPPCDFDWDYISDLNRFYGPESDGTPQQPKVFVSSDFPGIERVRFPSVDRKLRDVVSLSNMFPIPGPECPPCNSDEHLGKSPPEDPELVQAVNLYLLTKCSVFISDRADAFSFHVAMLRESAGLPSNTNILREKTGTLEFFNQLEEKDIE